MKPVVLFPYFDPDGLCQPHFNRIIPDLKNLFAGAFLGVDPETAQNQAGFMDKLTGDPFFHLCYTKSGSIFGDHCLAACEMAVITCDPAQILHFCFIDRLAFALQSEYRAAFINDIEKTGEDIAPRLFQRSEKAWETHPSNYRAIELMAVSSCELLLKQPLDLTWCHMALTVGQLQSIIPSIKRRDLVVLGEMVWSLIDRISVQYVDWLSWEDPFILGRDPLELKLARENSLGESRKRLGYVIPTLAMLYEKTGIPGPAK